jgi:5-methylcytosine-specific restriction protein B
MKLKTIIDQIALSDDWLSSYNKFVPLFIEEAKTNEDWKDWDKNIFYEFFERSADQCVSSLKQGYFTDVEKAKIKENWKSISMILKQIADNQETPQWDIYNELKRVIRQYTGLDRRASTNRLIASLQPKFLCTIVNEDKLYELFIYLKKNNIEGAPDYKGENWYKNSHAMMQFYKEQLPEKNYMEIITYPWQTRNYFIEKSKIIPNMSIENDKLIDLLNYKKQIIFQGAPGTGKTFTAKDIAEQLLYNEVSIDKNKQTDRFKEKNNQFKLIQFHPAYTYEDFVRGIIVDTTSGSPDYKTINKPLAHFAAEAYKNWIDSQKTPKVLSKERIFELQLEEFKKIVDEDIANKSCYKIDGTTAVITEVCEDSFRFTYEHDKRVNYTLLFSDLHKMNNSNLEFAIVKDVDEFELYMKRKASYYFRLYKSITAIAVDQSHTTNIQVKEQNYVLIIDEINRANLPAVLGELIYGLEYRGEKVDSMYAIDGDHSLILPPNLFIIGTMNTADRSVGLIDYAIRRRFAFVDMLPKILPNSLGFNLDLFKDVSSFFIKNIDEYIADEQCKLIPSDILSDEFRPEDVWIGHSYFIMNDKDGKVISNFRIKYEILPILKEYVKDGIFKDKTAAENKIDNLLSYL